MREVRRRRLVSDGGGNDGAREILKSMSRKVNGYVKAVLRLEEVWRKREVRKIG
jgi:hypothetical protein